MSNNCDGCRSNGSDASDCFYNGLDGCPCANCLVKTMCEKPCTDLTIHNEKMKDHKRCAIKFKEGLYERL